jgi:hypothetical protein
VTAAFLERRRAAAASAWTGDEIAVPRRGDRAYPFRAHSECRYLADRERPGGALAYAPADGWVELVDAAGDGGEFQVGLTRGPGGDGYPPEGEVGERRLIDAAGEAAGERGARAADNARKAI